MIHKFSQFNESSDLKDKVEMKRKLRTLVNEAMLDVEDELTDYEIKYENREQLILVTLDKQIGESNMFAKSVSDVDRVINEMSNSLKIVELIKESIGKIEDNFDKVWVNFENMNKIAIMFIFEKWWDKASNSFSIKDNTLTLNKKLFTEYLEKEFNLKDMSINHTKDLYRNHLVITSDKIKKSMMNKLWEELKDITWVRNPGETFPMFTGIFRTNDYSANNFALPLSIVIELTSVIDVEII